MSKYAQNTKRILLVSLKLGKSTEITFLQASHSNAGERRANKLPGAQVIFLLMSSSHLQLN